MDKHRNKRDKIELTLHNGGYGRDRNHCGRVIFVLGHLNHTHHEHNTQRYKKRTDPPMAAALLMSTALTSAADGISLFGDVGPTLNKEQDSNR